MYFFCLSVVESETEVWTELDPDLFRPFSVPFQLSGDTLVIFTFSIRVCVYIHSCVFLQDNPCQLPLKYREALDRRKK